MKLLLLAVALLAPLAARADPAAPDPAGRWLVQTGEAEVEIAHCGTSLCGRIAWMAEPRAPDGEIKTDIHNPDRALHGRLICGLPLLGGFTADPDGGWEGGWIYNPHDGATYHARLHVDAAGRLVVRGYVALALFGQSQVWTRVVGVGRGC